MNYEDFIFESFRLEVEEIMNCCFNLYNLMIRDNKEKKECFLEIETLLTSGSIGKFPLNKCICFDKDLEIFYIDDEILLKLVNSLN